MKMLTDNLLRPQPNRFTLHLSLLTLLSASSEPGNPPKCGQNLFLPNKPNFQKSCLTVTLDMIMTYNDIFPKNRKKNKPKAAQKRTKIEKKQTKTNENEQNSTPKNNPHKPNPNPSKPNFAFFILHFTFCSSSQFALIFQRFSLAPPLIVLQYPPAGCTVSWNLSEKDFSFGLCDG